jgi:curved DNA-binding protein CbpA
VRLHPDKCDLPGADEAFRRVSEAFNKVSGGAL